MKQSRKSRTEFFIYLDEILNNILCHITVKEDFEYYHLEIKYTTVIDVDKIYSKVTDFIDYKPAIGMNNSNWCILELLEQLFGN